MPLKCPSPLCLFCPNQESSPFHLLFSCPPKALVWNDIIREFLWPTVEIEDIFQALESLDFYNVNYCQRTSLPANMVIIIALSQVWICHWQATFNIGNFQPQLVTSRIRAAIQQFEAEENLASQTLF
ncbi:hypothetical protein BY458DRAFT_466274 [Sporodiniella umbellata]|nr:hypothetical protein BY458DRAFT_466274 [Sporodiniella umbellata]